MVLEVLPRLRKEEAMNDLERYVAIQCSILIIFVVIAACILWHSR